MANKEKVAVIGLGYVGLPLALLAKEKGYDVIGVDLGKDRVEKINDGKSPIADEHLEEWMTKVQIEATTNIEEASDADIYLICVPTPVKDKTVPDLGPLEGATRTVGQVMKKGALVVVESTINPGVCDDTVLPLLRESSGYSDDEFYLAHCPERINPGDAKFSVRNINRVLGANSDEALKKAEAFYKSIIEAEIKTMDSLKEAEAVKVVENTFRDINIAFVNELAMSFHKLGIDVENVIDGAATKPFAFMPHRPGPGVGGHCIPVDPYYLIEYAKGQDFNHDFLSMARRINSQMPEFTVELLQDALNNAGKPLKGTNIALLGLAYKADVDDDRESPSYELQRILENHGAIVNTYDPFILSASTHDTLDSVLGDSDAVLIATNHSEFKDLTPKNFKDHGIVALTDGKNIYRTAKDEFKKHDIEYVGIGIKV